MSKYPILSTCHILHLIERNAITIFFRSNELLVLDQNLLIFKYICSTDIQI